MAILVDVSNDDVRYIITMLKIQFVEPVTSEIELYILVKLIYFHFEYPHNFNFNFLSLLAVQYSFTCPIFFNYLKEINNEKKNNNKRIKENYSSSIWR